VAFTISCEKVSKCSALSLQVSQSIFLLILFLSSHILEQKPKEPEIKEVTKTISPSDKPFFICANGNCDEGVHRNENYSKKPNKKCKNCDSLNGEKKCTNCGNKNEDEFDDLDDEELKELGIPMPPENHEGHNHE